MRLGSIQILRAVAALMVVIHHAEAEALIRAQHSYALPEIIAVPITGGSAEYLAWVRAAVSVPASR